MAIKRGFSCGFLDCSDKLWRPRDLAEVRLERECRLGLAVDDAILFIKKNGIVIRIDVIN